MTQARQTLTGNGSKTKLDASEFSDPDSGEARAAAGTGSAATKSNSTVKTNNSAFTGTTSTDRPEGKNGDQMLASAGFTPLINPMSELFQPAYHFKFYLPPDLGTIDESNSNQSIVIAETGLTGMNIQDVNIESFVGPNIRTKNATATSITIKIYEPMGNMLPDIMYQAASRMAIANYLKAPWMLDLTLHGYDVSGARVVVDGSPWRWKLIMTDMQSQISETGTMHTITALPLMEVALNNQYCMIPVAKAQSGNTVGEALQNIVKGLNEDSALRYGGPPYFIEYAVEDVPYRSEHDSKVARPFDHKILADEPSKNDQRSAVDRGTMQSQFAPGTDFPSIVDQLMSSTVTAVEQSRLSRSIEPGKDGLDKEEDIKSVTSVMHRVDTKVELKDYHPVFGDYMRKITYVVRPYDSLRLLTSMGRATNFDKDDDLHLRKAAYATKRAFLKKQYDYIFTGLNTEVEKFDITVNFRWAVMVPRLQGYNLYGSSTVPAEVSDNAQWLQDARGKLDDNANKIGALQTKLDTEKPVPDPNNPDAEALYDDNGTKKTKAQIEQEIAQLKAASEPMKNEFTKRSNAQITAANKERAAIRKSLPNKGNVIEDDVAAEIQGGDSKVSNELPPLPITIYQDGDNPAVETSTGTPSQANNGKSIYGTLLNQLYGSFDGNLQNISLDIKGDPYWLGPGVDSDIIIDESSDTRPVFMNGEHMFAFRFKMPQGFDSGQVSVPKDEDSLQGAGNTNIVTGFYAVLRVVNKFAGGAFKQTLEATRIPGWQFEKIIDGQFNPDEPLKGAPAQYGGVATDTGGEAKQSGGSSRSSGSQGGRTSTPRGIRNNNPGNLRDSAFARRQIGYVGADANGFAQFDSASNGIAAQERLLKYNYLDEPTTVSAVINRYAPGNENSAASRANYIKYVTDKVGKSNVTAADTKAVAKAMRDFENGTTS
jgi:hypothetical protein